MKLSLLNKLNTLYKIVSQINNEKEILFAIQNIDNSDIFKINNKIYTKDQIDILKKQNFIIIKMIPASFEVNYENKK